MEILMRLAFKRYDESNHYPLNFSAKEASSKAEAIRLMYEKNLMPHYGSFNP